MNNISVLLGSGFSAPMGYPTGEQLNERLQNFRKCNVGISPDGKLFSIVDVQKNALYGNPYSVCLDCCIALIEMYSREKDFDYEHFFEFLSIKEYRRNQMYLSLCNSFTNDSISIDFISSNIDDVYNQMVSHLLKDGNNSVWYDNLPYYVGKIDEYDGFLNLLKIWKKDRIIYIHTLNHDMLFESFNKTDYINGEICDGFEELGSDFYGELRTNGDRTYHVRLERFTANYNRNIRLYKLHGSLDYVLYYRTSSDGITRYPLQYVKTKYGIGYDNLLRDTHHGDNYERYPFACHANFLTGTTSKIRKYEDPLLYKPLFDSFKNNLQNSEKLIIIGYGCKDLKINDIIANNFTGGKVFIVDPYCDNNNKVLGFAKRIDAKIIIKQIANVNTRDFV